VHEVGELRLHAVGALNDKRQGLLRLGIEGVTGARGNDLRIVADLAHGFLQIVGGDVGHLLQIGVRPGQDTRVVGECVLSFLVCRDINEQIRDTLSDLDRERSEPSPNTVSLVVLST
jgi:hypothetical protein